MAQAQQTTAALPNLAQQGSTPSHPAAAPQAKGQSAPAMQMTGSIADKADPASRPLFRDLASI